MTAMPTIDMTHILRLTQSGELKEATALIQRGLNGRASKPASAPQTPAMHRLSPPDGVLLAKNAQRHPAKPPEQYKRRSFDLPGLRMKPRTKVPVPDGAGFSTHRVHTEDGVLSYKLYVPSGSKGAQLPLVVMLHGCTQNPDDFAVGTRMNTLAEFHGFLVAYPEQPRSANASRCWNWFNPGDQIRDRGEPALIAAATRQIIADRDVDPARVFVAGLSAGGAAAAIMGCAYPDLYAGIGVHSGLACGSASDLPSAFAAMRGQSRMSGGPKNRVPTIIFHGTTDPTVSATNADEIASQLDTGRTSRSIQQGTCDDGTGYVQTVWRSPEGAIVGELWMIGGGGHAWSGGDPAGSYAVASGPDASREMLRFFSITLGDARSARLDTK